MDGSYTLRYFCAHFQLPIVRKGDVAMLKLLFYKVYVTFATSISVLFLYDKVTEYKRSDEYVRRMSGKTPYPHHY